MPPSLGDEAADSFERHFRDLLRVVRSGARGRGRVPSVDRKRSPSATRRAIVWSASVHPVSVASTCMERAASPATELTPDGPGVEIERLGPPAHLALDVAANGESLLFATLSSPGTDWSRRGAECAVLSVDVDGRTASDVIVVSDRPAMRGIALGTLSAGRHDVALRFSPASRAATRTIRVADPLLVHAPARCEEEIVLRHAPILYGRSNEELGGPFQNTVTDAPLLAWHRLSSVHGRRTIEYSVLWTHEDGGTDGPALMARWGRTTDLEWIYRVDVDDRGERIPGSAVFQGREHETRAFAGAFEGDHPVLQTCTDNNMVDDVIRDGALRFFLAADRSPERGRARESMMDLEPRTYWAMAAELSRERRIQPWTGPNEATLGDPRDYFFLEIDAQAVASGGTGAAFAVGVRLFGDGTLHRSDAMRAELACSARGTMRTAVRLPPRTRPNDVAELRLCRAVGAKTDVIVFEVMEAFTLNEACEPDPVSIRLQGPVRLPADRTETLLWSRLSDPELTLDERP